MVLRMIFFVLSICFGCVYWSKYRKISSGVGVHNRVLPEQKVILLLSLATLTFNDPLYILTLLDHNKGTYLSSKIDCSSIRCLLGTS